MLTLTPNRVPVFRYQVIRCWGQLPDGIAVGVVFAETENYGLTRYHWIEGVESGEVVAAWLSRRIA